MSISRSRRPRLSRGAEFGGCGALSGPRYVDFTVAKRHGFAGARSVGDVGGPFGGTVRRGDGREAPRLCRGAGRGGCGGPFRGHGTSTSRSRSATALPGRGAWGMWGALSGPRYVDFTVAKRH